MPLLDPDPVATPARGERRPARALRVGGGARAWSGSAPASSTRWCSPARCASTRPPRSIRRRSSTPCGAGFPACYCYLVGTPRAGLRRRQPGAAGAPRRRPRPDRRARRHHPPQRRPVGGRPARRAAAASRTRSARSRRSSSARIERTLRPVSVWVAAADEPVLVKVAERPAPGHADPGPARRSGLVRGAGRPTASHAGGGRGAAAKAAPADPGARGPRPRLVRRDRGLERPVRGRRVLRGASAARCCAAGWRTSTRATGSCATRCRRTSSPRPRSSSRRCCRCWPDDRVSG